MSRPKLQSSMMATTRCLLALCVFGLLLASQAAATMPTAAKGLQPFAIEGEITNLYPGARVPLNVRVTNPHDLPLRVRSIGVEVQDSDLTGCGREWVRPGRQVNISTLVPPKSTSFLSYPVWMLDDAPVDCRGATWPLSFTGAGTVSEGQAPPDDDDTDNPADEAAPGDDSGNGSVLPFTGGDLILVIALSLALTLAGVFLLALRRSWADES